jgi:UDP-N-acetylmuramate--alanine ligase
LNADELLSSSNIKRVHLTGIGGASMSGLAEILVYQGYIVTGSDERPSPVLQKLEKAGIRVTIGHYAENVAGADLLVYTAAVRPDNIELITASRAGIPCIDRATLLGELMKKYPMSFAVSGTHGKTTTTSMISMIMLEEGLDPTIHIGGELAAIGGSTRIGGSEYFVAEACEYSGSFLKFYPRVAVILNVEYDHVDYFKNIDEVKRAFHSFAGLVPGNGHIVVNGDDEIALDALNGISCDITTFGINDSSNTWSASNIEFDDMGCASYTLLYMGNPATEIRLKVPGIHNVSNSLAAIAACSLAGCSVSSAAKALLKFTGTCRRFEIKGVSEGITVVDDYAHHPSEIAATLKAAAKYNHSRIWCVFQPHTYSRTIGLMDDFTRSFDNADFVILTDIYAARETDTGEVHSSTLAEKIARRGKKAVYIKDFDSIVELLDKNVSSGDLVITMGAGDVYKVGDMFLEARKKLAVS